MMWWRFPMHEERLVCRDLGTLLVRHTRIVRTTAVRPSRFGKWVGCQPNHAGLAQKEAKTVWSVLLLHQGVLSVITVIMVCTVVLLGLSSSESKPCIVPRVFLLSYIQVA